MNKRSPASGQASGVVVQPWTTAGKVACLWYKCGMARLRISTTVDEQLLTSARQARSGLPDSALMDEALAALLHRHRTAEIDAAYSAYETSPIDSNDEWGDLDAFRKASGGS